ncbi:M56 family metallopeptidase [Sinosporangium siamense]|uniref:Peptidase M48 domain-containing protein n=1 Tax=Sinosporangium siamense TaxID=1367973 RepID=A0A919RDE6_9ACTN|nr:M56 family metallopeptidase [Sinosporangium siamense]GII91843.1 hypothetical protein Ssi02_20740 [Sinosporangium siamense]
MTAALLGLYAVAAAFVLPRLLSRGAWRHRAPRLALALWQAAGASVVVSALLAGLALAVPASAIGHGLASFFEACALLLGEGEFTASPAALAGLAGSGLVAARIAYCAVAELLRARAERRRHAELLALLGRHDHELGAVVVDHDERVAYCLPGRPGQAVITTGALGSLAPAQVAAVLAHEHAHLRGRHHLVLVGAAALRRAFPGVPLFSRAKVEITRLVELAADDVAARRHPRVQIAAALVGLATGRPPAFTLGAGGETALMRVRRMLNPEAPLGRRERLAGLLAVGLLLTGPAAVVLVPGVGSFLAHHCHTLIML